MNIYKIAKKANVSIATVSRVLNNSEKVKNQTRKKILNIIKSQNYKPRIVRNKLPNIMILINDKKIFLSEYFSNLLDGITEALNMLNYQETIARADNQINPDDLLFLIRERKADGIIVLLSNKNTQYLSAFIKEDIPFLLINNSSFPQYNYIDTDNYDGMTLILDYLYSKGHKKIAYITHDINASDHYQRYKAYENFLKNHNIEFSKDLVIFVNDMDPQNKYIPYEHGYLSAKKLFKSGKDFTAVACTNDALAFGIFHYCHENNISIPEKISITGYDNYNITPFIDPRLTTINQNLFQLGNTAVMKLINIINNPSEKVNLILKSQLIKGKSVRSI